MSGYKYGPRRNAAIQRFLRAVEFSDRPTLFDAKAVAAELSQQTHLARQYDRALRHFDADRLRAENADLRERIRLARDIVRSRAWSEQRHYHGELLDYLDLRRPLPKRRSRR